MTIEFPPTTPSPSAPEEFPPTTPSPSAPAAAVCDGGPLDCGGGLLIAIRRALRGIAIGEILEVRSEAASVAVDLPAWCDLAGHRLERVRPAGISSSYFVRKGC